MQRTLLAAACAAALLAVPHAAGQTLSFSGHPGAMGVASATAGASPDVAMESTTTYALAGVTTQSRIMGRLESPLPAGVSLRVTLSAPAGSAGAGSVFLSTLDQELVGRIPAGSYSGLTITYMLAATAAAGTLPASSISVAFTVVPSP